MLDDRFLHIQLKLITSYSLLLVLHCWCVRHVIFCSSQGVKAWVYIEDWPETKSYFPKIRRPKGKYDLIEGKLDHCQGTI